MNKFLILMILAVVCPGCNSGQDTEKPESKAEAPVAGPAMPMEEFMTAALNGRDMAIEEAIRNQTDVNIRDQEGRTALMLAAFNGHSKIVDLLIKAGAKPGLKESVGRTALMFACTGTDTETVRLLLDAGAKVNLPDEGEHFTPLMWAAAEGRIPICRLLLERGADPSLKDVDGDTAAKFAAERGHTELVKILEAAKAK